MLKQISVFIENRAGRLFHVAQTLAAAGVDLRALNISDTKDFGIMRCVVSDVDRAQESLKQEGCAFTVSDVLGVCVSDRPGSFEKFLELLSKNGLQIEYLYSFAGPLPGNAAVIFHALDPEKAEAILTDAGFTLLSAARLKPGSGI